ncbi:MAG: virulence factor [Chloroflexi bacterium]|nr:virulence factor [Chloroflexota bacterium]MBP8058520.1 virulence factor [Chloroflexota bacterium]
MTPYQILSWHAIPVQVRAGGRHNRVSKELPARFQEAVDNAAMLAGLTGTDAYLDGFTWGEMQKREGTPEEVAAAIIAELEAQYETVDWKGVAAAIRTP